MPFWIFSLTQYIVCLIQISWNKGSYVTLRPQDLHSQPNTRLLDINYSLNVWSVLGRSYAVYRWIYHQIGCRINGSKVIGPLTRINGSKVIGPLTTWSVKKKLKKVVGISIFRIKYDDTHIYENNHLILRWYILKHHARATHQLSWILISSRQRDFARFLVLSLSWTNWSS